MKKTPTLVGLLIAGAVTAASVSRLATPGAQIAVPSVLASPSGEAVGAPAVAEVAGALDVSPFNEPPVNVRVLPPSSAIALVDDEPVSSPAPSVAVAIEPETNNAAVIRMSVPFHTQKDGDRFQGSNCGPATLSMVLGAFGMDYGNSELRFLSHTYQGTVGARTGTALQHMAHVAADYGLEPIGPYQRPDGLYGKDGFARWTVDDVRAEVLAGHPVIPLVKFRLLPGHEDSTFRADHYVVIYGVEGDSFLYHDPIYDSPLEGAARWMTSEQLATAMKPTLVPQQAVAFAPGSHVALPVG
jgi:hypothetical protein